MTKKENIFVSWHYTAHGIAWLKHILSVFNNKFYNNTNISDIKINLERLNQENLAPHFDNSNAVKKGFVFDKVYYVTTAQKHFDALSSRRFRYRENILKDFQVKKMNLDEVWKKILDREKKLSPKNDRTLFNANIEDEFKFVKQAFDTKTYQNFRKEYWREIHHYSVDEQIKWFTEISNAKDIYANKFEEVPVHSIKDLRDVASIAQNLAPAIDRLKKKHLHANWYFCVSLGSNETQTAWYILSEAKRLPSNSHFLQIYDIKAASEKKRFHDFFIKETSPQQINALKEQLSLKISDTPQSDTRIMAQQKLKTFTELGFSILLLGERGTGKSRLAETTKTQGVPFVAANCASFANDTMAESELFGYTKGAFTDAKADKLGLIAKANNGMLFLDEIHMLSKSVQGKLMKAFQTDEHNKFHIRRLGSTVEEPIECRLIFASNKTIPELQQCLLPDFYDRIVQLVIEIPPLRESREDIYQDWKVVWKNLKIGDPPKYNSAFKNWLIHQPLWGNFRDLQKIAIHYHTYQQLPDTIKNTIPQKDGFEYAKSEFLKYHGKNVEENKFDSSKSLNELIADYKRQLALWAIAHFGSAK
jgi:transcriptional regulator with AAA-type ATPase domain